MSKRKKQPLTKYECSIIKALLQLEYSHQDIQYLINIGRDKTINNGRIAEISYNHAHHWSFNIAPATEDEVEKFLIKQKSWNLQTNLNPYIHTKLFNAREAMASAVQLFNNPSGVFNLEGFLLLSITAYTYLLQSIAEDKNIPIKDKNNNYQEHIGLTKLVEKLHNIKLISSSILIFSPQWATWFLKACT